MSEFIVARSGCCYDQPSKSVIVVIFDVEKKTYVNITNDKAREIEKILNS